jgi:hypothetical protein
MESALGGIRMIFRIGININMGYDLWLEGQFPFYFIQKLCMVTRINQASGGRAKPSCLELVDQD